ARPQVARQVVAHALEADELRAGNRLGDGLATGDVDQRVVETVHHQRGHLDVAQVPGAVRLTDTRGELAQVAARVVGPLVAAAGEVTQIFLVEGEPLRADEP